MGDSITDNWGHRIAQFFPGKPYLNRGIGGQVTAQMLLRFYPDVIALKPKAVLILAGTNDIGGNIGPVPLEITEDYLASMAEMARGNNIKVIIASLTPVCDYHEKTPQTARRPPEKILALNRWIKDYLREEWVCLSGLLFGDGGRQGHVQGRDPRTMGCIPRRLATRLWGPWPRRRSGGPWEGRGERTAGRLTIGRRMPSCPTRGVTAILRRALCITRPRSGVHSSGSVPD